MNLPTAGILFAREGCTRAVLSLLMVLALLNTLAGTIADPDLWGYLAFGRLFWESDAFPYRDVFSYVPTLDPWVYHEWLTGVLFYPVYRVLGSLGLQLLKYGFGLGAALLVYLTARRRGASPLAAALTLWLVHLFLEMGYSPVRAQVFTYFFFALSLYLLERARLTGQWRGLLLLALIQIPWCNLHGGFLAGLGLIGLYGLGEAICRRPCRPYLGVLLLAALATLVNPYGPTYWQYLFRAVTMPRPEITEWLSVFRAYQVGLPLMGMIYFALLIMFSVFLAWWARWRELTPMLVLLVTLYLGLKHQRHQVFFFLSAAAYLPVLLTAYLKEVQSRPRVATFVRRLGWAVPLILAVCLTGVYGYRLMGKSPLTLQTPALPDRNNPQQLYYPVGALQYLEQHRLSGKLLTEFHWGEYLLWLLHPRCRVALDGRYETVYPDEVAQKYSDFIYGRADWRRFLEDYPPDLILIDRRSRVARLLEQDPAWQRVYADPGAVLFVRRGYSRLPEPPALSDAAVTDAGACRR